MAEIEVIEWKKDIPMNKPEIIRFQLMMECYDQKILNISPALLDCLTLLGEMGSTGLISFCDILKEKGIFKSTQSSRNAIVRLQEKKLIVKEGKNKKNVALNPALKIQTSGNVFVNIRCLSPIQPIKK